MITSWNQRHSLDPRLTLSHDYVLPSLFLHITAWWLCPLHTIQLKRAKWSGHCFVFASICWSVVALFRMHWSVQWLGRDVPRRQWWGDLTLKYTIQLGGESAGTALTRRTDAIEMRLSFLRPFNRGTYRERHPRGINRQHALVYARLHRATIQWKYIETWLYLHQVDVKQAATDRYFLN